MTSSNRICLNDLQRMAVHAGVKVDHCAGALLPQNLQHTALGDIATRPAEHSAPQKSTGYSYAFFRMSTQNFALPFNIKHLVDRPQISGTIGGDFKARCGGRREPIFTNQEVDMNRAAFLDLTIEKRGRQYFVILTDNIAVNEVGPFKSKKEALKVYRHLASRALALGGQRQPTSAENRAADAHKGAA